MPLWPGRTCSCLPATFQATTFGNIALLPGVGRAVALREGRVQEAVVRLEDVPRVEAWAFVNSLRGWLAATVG